MINVRIKKLKNVFLISLLILTFSNVFAGTKVACMDLSDPNHGNPLDMGWKILQGDPSGMHTFINAMISTMIILGQRTVTCNYNNGVALYQIGQIQRDVQQNWELVSQGGTEYWQCLRDVNACAFWMGQ